MVEIITKGVEVRQHNGQCEYGPWLAVDADGVPFWVVGLIADEIMGHDADEGIVSQGGCAFAWRKREERPMSEAIEVGRRIGRAMARDARAEDMPREWTGLDAQDADIATEAGFVPDSEEWETMERAARAEFRRMME